MPVPVPVPVPSQHVGLTTILLKRLSEDGLLLRQFLNYVSIAQNKSQLAELSFKVWGKVTSKNRKDNRIPTQNILTKLLLQLKNTDVPSGHSTILTNLISTIDSTLRSTDFDPPRSRHKFWSEKNLSNVSSLDYVIKWGNENMQYFSGIIIPCNRAGTAEDQFDPSFPVRLQAAMKHRSKSIEREILLVAPRR